MSTDEGKGGAASSWVRWVPRRLEATRQGHRIGIDRPRTIPARVWYLSAANLHAMTISSGAGRSVRAHLEPLPRTDAFTGRPGWVFLSLYEARAFVETYRRAYRSGLPIPDAMELARSAALPYRMRYTSLTTLPALAENMDTTVPPL